MTHPLAAVLRDHEDWLVHHIGSYARDRGYTRRLPAVEAIVRIAVIGLTGSMTTALAIREEPLEIGPDTDFSEDSVAAFAVEEAKLHHRRGIPLRMFLGLMKYFRQGYLDLLEDLIPAEESLHGETHRQWNRFINSFFDHIEIAFCSEWSRSESEESRKEMQVQIIRQEKMASIGQLAAGVAHEINNPLGFVTSNLTTLSRYADRFDQYIAALQQSVYSCPSHPGLGELDEIRQRLKVDYIISDVKELVNESIEGANRVLQIVKDLKSFSRVDQAEQAWTNINEALETTINIAWNEIKYVAELRRQFGDLPPVLCHPQQLNQVFLNLLINAAQAMEHQGLITVRTWSDPEQIFVVVEDTGKGMPEEIMHHIFDPFFTTKEVGKGTGLGLSISADIVARHGGSISVTSEQGKGTAFTVRLPLAARQAEETKKHAAEAGVGGAP